VLKVVYLLKSKIMTEKYIIDDTNYCGKCPECDHDWNGGLNKDNKPTSKLVRLESSDGDSWNSGEKIHYQCPNCNVAWNSETGERTDKFKAMIVDHKVMDDFINKILNKKPKD
jgi:uncharacterized Zn ribbon protein